MSDNSSYLKADEQDDNQSKKYGISDLKAFVILFQYAKDFWFYYLIGFSLIFLASYSLIYSANLMGNLVEFGIIPKKLDYSIRTTVLILVLEGASFLLLWQGRKIITNYSSLTILRIRERLFEHLQLLPISFYDRQPQGRIVTRITHDVEGIEDFFTNSLGKLLSSGITATLALIAMCMADFKIGSILVLTIVPGVLFIFLSRNLVRRTNRRMSKANSAVNSKLSEFISAIEVIRSYGLEKWSQKEYNKSVNEHEKSQLDANLLYSWSRPLVSFLCSLPIVFLVWFGSSDVFSGVMSVGLFVTFIRYCERFTNPIMTLAQEFHVIQQAFTSAERVSTFLLHQEESLTLGDNGKIDNFSFSGDIKFENIWMAYDKDQWVLKDLSFHIHSGEKIGFVGRTGCGKSTTVSLLSRLYEYQKGHIVIDGQDIRNFNREFLRSNIGFVAQDPIVYHGTLKDNLCPDGKVSEDFIINACKETGFYKVMEDTKLSMDSIILDGGSNLSVGERQLLALTRILITDPSILILDEATANIDPWFEELIHKAVEKIMEGRTCLMIAHRLATLESCDRIFVFDQGQLIENGSPDDLMAQKGKYYNLHFAQSNIAEDQVLQ